MISIQANRFNHHKAIILLLFTTVAAEFLETFSLTYLSTWWKPRPNKSPLLKMVTTTFTIKEQKTYTESKRKGGHGKVRRKKANGSWGQIKSGRQTVSKLKMEAVSDGLGEIGFDYKLVSAAFMINYSIIHTMTSTFLFHKDTLHYTLLYWLLVCSSVTWLVSVRYDWQVWPQCGVMSQSWDGLKILKGLKLRNQGIYIYNMVDIFKSRVKSQECVYIMKSSTPGKHCSSTLTMFEHQASMM